MSSKIYRKKLKATKSGWMHDSKRKSDKKSYWQQSVCEEVLIPLMMTANTPTTTTVLSKNTWLALCLLCCAYHNQDFDAIMLLDLVKINTIQIYFCEY